MVGTVPCWPGILKNVTMMQLGPNRVGSVEDEVLDWLQERLDRREDLTDTPE